MDYQKTLNLPQTDFSMRAGLAQKEPEQLKAWARQGLHADIRKKSKDLPPFILHDGPPYANGDIHIGHALNKILKDFIVKMKTMQGYDSLYIPGWDCHGLPIEHQLFKQLKKKKNEVDTPDFRKKAHAYALKWVGIQREQFERLGVFGRWDKPYLTLDPEYEYWILKSFEKLVEGGYVYRGLKPVNWCADCETALAEAEVEYEDHTSPSVYVKFRVNNPEVLKGVEIKRPLFLLIWTTTPWTLLANVAVAVHRDYEYELVEYGDEILIIEKSRRNVVLSKGGLVFDEAKIQTVKGQSLQDLLYKHPFGLKENCRVITVDYVTKEEGTGLVHTAPGHGQEDFQAGQEYGLDILMPVDDRGVFTADAGKFEGLHVFKANDEITAELKERRTLFASQQIAHSYPHCWRCKKPVIFRATQQWFLNIDHKGLRGTLKDIIRQDVQWIPPAGLERILGMVVTRPDWCLSRQRHWGVPIPALVCHGCRDEHKLFPEVIRHFAQIVKNHGTDIWFEKDVKDLLPPGFTCPDCGGGHFDKTHDILDVWFDSGVSHQAVIGPMMGRRIPVDLYLEGSDQHRGWFQSSLIPSVAMHGKAPFKAVLTHGFVVDGQGRKMSKSLGNVMSPQDLIKNNGADILRLWVASSNYNEDIRLSQEIFERVIDAYRKIRNTMRFLLGNLNGFDPDKDQLPYHQLQDIDQWALLRLAEVVTEIKQAYNAYEFAKVYKIIYAFCNEDLSGIYLDILKDRLYTSASNAAERLSAQTVLFHIVNHLVRLLAPMFVFTTEEIFFHMPKEQSWKQVSSVHLLDWLAVPPEWKNEAVGKKFELLMDLRPFVMKALEDKRRGGEIGGSLEAKVIFRSASQGDLAYLRNMQEVLPASLIVSQVEVEEVEKLTAGVGGPFAQTDVVVTKADGNKCPRCWNFRTLGEDPDYPDICRRCADAVKMNIREK